MSIQKTSDGSFTIYSEQFGQTYHSIHGAKTESDKVFIELGLDYVSEYQKEINILEIGLGTALNAFLTLQKAKEHHLKINYVGIEAYPLKPEQYQALPQDLQTLHTLPWNQWQEVDPFFRLFKAHTTLENFIPEIDFDLIYFDAFSPEAQPELWSQEVFRNMYNVLKPLGVLTTYCSKGSVQRNLKSAGFDVEKHKGPPHKREVLRALKSQIQ